MLQVDFPVFDSNAGLMELPGPGCLGMFSDAIDPQAKADIDAFNAFIDRSNQPSFFITNKTWEMLCNGENHAGKWLADDYEVYGFVFCLALKRWETHDKENRGKEKGKLFGYAYFRIRTIVKKKATDLAGISGFEAFVEEENIAYADILEALRDNSELNTEQVKFLTPEDEELRKIIDKEVVKKGNEAYLRETFFGDSHPSAGQDKKRKIYGIFSNEGGIFGKDRIKEIKQEKGARVSIACNIRPYDEEKDKEDGQPDLSRREIYYHFKINPQYKTNIPCPMPQVC